MTWKTVGVEVCDAGAAADADADNIVCRGAADRGDGRDCGGSSSAAVIAVVVVMLIVVAGIVVVAAVMVA